MGGTPESWIEAFANATYGRLAMVSAHQYGNVNCSDASGWSFVQRDTYRCVQLCPMLLLPAPYSCGCHSRRYIEGGARGLVQLRNKYMAPSTGVLIEETASAMQGGCANASNRCGIRCAAKE